MGATFARLKVWVAWEVLTHTDLNAEFDNFLDNLTPAGVDDASVSVAAMRTTTDPYPGSVESQATSLEGEIQRLRYVIAQLSGKTYWYQDPTTIMYGDSATTISPFYNDTAPTGWTIQNTLDDKLLFVTKGSGAGGQTGGAVHSTGTWAQLTHQHTTGDVTLTAAQSGVPAHTHIVGGTDGSGAPRDQFNASVLAGSYPLSTNANAAANATAAHNHGVTGVNDIVNTWRPAAYNVILAKLN